MKKAFVAAFITFISVSSFVSALVAELPDDYQDDTKLYCPGLTQTLKRGARDATTGGQVTELQLFLGDYFNLPENEIVSGFFGRNTQKYVMQFQQQNALPAYGVAGSLTRAKIAQVCKGGEIIGAKKCVVGGCSGQMCVEEGSGGISTCEYREEYACYKKASCTRQATGQCGWTQTQELKQCLVGKQVCDHAAPPEGCYWDARGAGCADDALVCKEKPIGRVFRVTPDTGGAPLAVTFTTPAGDKEAFSVDFGDGTSASMSVSNGGTARSISHTYARAGTFVARLNKMYQCNATAGDVCIALASEEAGTAVVTVIGAVSTPPILKADSTGGTAPHTVAFTTDRPTENNYTINFGDGLSPTQTFYGSAKYTYPNPGTYYAKLYDNRVNCATSSIGSYDQRECAVSTVQVVVSAVGNGSRGLYTSLISPGPVGSNSVYVSMKATGLTESAAPNAHIDWGDGTVEPVPCELAVGTTAYLSGAWNVAAAVMMPLKCPAYGYGRVFAHNYKLDNSAPVFEYAARIVSDKGEFARNPLRLWHNMPQVYSQ